MPKQTDSIELTNSLQGTVEYTASQEIIPEEKILQQGSFTYTSNGERTENPSEGYDGFSQVAVNVNVQPNLQSKSVSYTENNDYTISPDDGYQGLSSVAVNVNVSGSAFPETPTDAVIFYSPTQFSLKTKNGDKNWNGTLYYSTDHSTWSEWNGTSITSAKTGNWHLLYLKGSGNNYFIGSTPATELQKHWVFVGGAIICSGNFERLLDESNPVMNSRCFSRMFYEVKNVNFINISLPTVIKESCFYYMFYGCESLTSAPALSATELANSCYGGMFYNCTSLVSAPALPATTLKNACYSYMFYGCSSLVIPPSLPATTLAASCYAGMFSNCTSLLQAPELPATTLKDNCYQEMFIATAITSAPALPATTVTTYCYANMFGSCKLLTTPPSLPATTLATYCYSNMFASCTALASIPELPAQTLITNCYNQMFRGCSLVKLSTDQISEYQTEYRIPTSGEGAAGTNSLSNMFYQTGGTFTGTPTINTTYYTSNTVIPAN